MERPGLLFAAGEAVFLTIALLPDARRSLAAYLLLFLSGALLSLFAARSLSASRPRSVLLFAAAFRLTMLLHQPDLSEDVYRYVWDAKVALAGRSPYAFAPDDPEVSRLFPELRPHLTHRGFRTVYPPVAQAAFRAGAMVPGSEVVATKAIFAAADVAIVALLSASGGETAGFAAALYAFHPLAVTESAGAGHLDSLGVALLLAAALLLQQRHSFAAGLAFAASVLTKYVPAAATLPLAKRGGLRFAVTALVFGSAVWGLASRIGGPPAGDLGAYATRWEFNSLLYPAVAGVVDSTQLPAKAKTAYMHWKDVRPQRPWMQRVFPWFYTALFARVAIALGLAVALILIAARVRDVETALFASLAAFLIASPTIHPWYMLWILPFAAKKCEPAFLYLSFAVVLSYAIPYPLAGWTPVRIRVAEYVPFAILLGVSLWRAGRRHA
ncbi:MAG: hypothetical protein DMF55_01275 [Acidobacteria bacterium]|nr:MAG: hypothetical protein DMF55_01275 [Acidobacteriota bacterium]